MDAPRLVARGCGSACFVASAVDSSQGLRLHMRKVTRAIGHVAAAHVCVLCFVVLPGLDTVYCGGFKAFCFPLSKIGCRACTAVVGGSIPCRFAGVTSVMRYRGPYFAQKINAPSRVKDAIAVQCATPGAEDSEPD